MARAVCARFRMHLYLLAWQRAPYSQTPCR